MIRKYYSLIGVCKAYRIAIVMCLHCKTHYLKANLGWDDERIQNTKSMVIWRFEESYAPPNSVPATLSTPTPPSDMCIYSLDQFSHPTTEGTILRHGDDDTRAYLDAPLIDMAESDNVIAFWTHKLSSTPYLAKFALSFCSAPATSAASERSFSEGWNQATRNQTSY
ncbi:hypothetical protein VKT23_017323 [Stygiomarasmius scandens]|uniref:HAT C-terminal dimerisation domain-containing protein n=1 Tax=Marasmiellus scandens TaxID=2682957 RepID=A0ABR1IX02_9AGAR